MEKQNIKILTVCIGGMVRSAGISDVLRNDMGIDSVALSAINNHDDTMVMMCEWADVIVPVEPQYENEVPNEYKFKWGNCKMWDTGFNNKRKVMNLGADVWGNARHPELRQIIKTRINEIWQNNL